MEENMQVTVEDMMRAREARFFMQQTMLARYPGALLVCLTMNVAGPVKVNAQIERAFACGMEHIRAAMAGQACFEAEIHEKTGAEAVFVVCAQAEAVKRRLCALEDGCALGRLWDIDVIAPDGSKISRTDVGLPPRKCLLCGQDAPVCARSRAHTVEALFARTMEIIDAHFEEAFARRVGQQAQRALLTEVAVSPKPGLVDRMNAGAHRDMDVFTFIDSACALSGYFESCARAGLEHRGKRPQDCFDALRVQGLLAEAAMNRATGGVNTHKGAIFSLGVFAAALGMGFDGAGSNAQQALLRCGEMTGERMREELAAISAREAKTFGERAYKERGVGGVRAEAASGFACVRERGLPRLCAALDQGAPLNDAGLCALVALMARTQDTNVLRRGGETAARKLLEDAKALDEQICAYAQEGTLIAHMDSIRETLAAWDVAMSAAGISPGGCADMLALTLLAHFMQA